MVRQHPDIDQPKSLDVLAKEVESFKEISDMVVVEVTMPDGARRTSP